MKVVVPILAMTVLAVAMPAHTQVEEMEAATETTAVEEEDPSQQIRCRNRRVTGSNARRIRTCLTLEQWSELARSGNRDARRVVDESTRNAINRD